jgi:hypothetical protein
MCLEGGPVAMWFGSSGGHFKLTRCADPINCSQSGGGTSSEESVYSDCIDKPTHREMLDVIAMKASQFIDAISLERFQANEYNEKKATLRIGMFREIVEYIRSIPSIDVQEDGEAIEPFFDILTSIYDDNTEFMNLHILDQLHTYYGLLPSIGITIELKNAVANLTKSPSNESMNAASASSSASAASTNHSSLFYPAPFGQPLSPILEEHAAASSIFTAKKGDPNGDSNATLHNADRSALSNPARAAAQHIPVPNPPPVPIDQVIYRQGRHAPAPAVAAVTGQSNFNDMPPPLEMVNSSASPAPIVAPASLFAFPAAQALTPASGITFPATSGRLFGNQHTYSPTSTNNPFPITEYKEANMSNAFQTKQVLNPEQVRNPGPARKSGRVHKSEPAQSVSNSGGGRRKTRRKTRKNKNKRR